VCARRCMSARHGSGPCAPATILHAETSSGNGSELCITLRAPLGVRWRERGAGAVSPCHILSWGGFGGAAPHRLHRFTPFLRQCAGLGCALLRVVTLRRRAVGGGRQVPETTDSAMLPALNDRCSPVQGTPAPIDSAFCSSAHEPSNMGVGAGNGGPCGPCGQPKVGAPSADLGP